MYPQAAVGRRRIRVHPETLYTESGSGSWFPRIRLVHSCKAREQVDSVLRIQQPVVHHHHVSLSARTAAKHRQSS